MKIAFITYEGSIRYSAANGFDEIQHLLPFLQGKGLDIHFEIWDSPTADWTRYDVALLRMPWDYSEKYPQFVQWLAEIEALGIRMLNDYQTVRWNMDKHYLNEIISAGYNVIPSLFLGRRSEVNLDALFSELKTEELIIKPCISAGSRNTLRIARNNAGAFVSTVNSLVANEAFIVQPFMTQVFEGEWSLTFFGGQYSHTIVKKPKTGDFRVQQIFGGTIERIDPPQEYIHQAASYLSAFAPDALYARVDGLLVDGKFALMELELIEPFLYLSYHPDAPDNFYRALKNQLDSIQAPKSL